MKKNVNVSVLLGLHILLLVYSVSSVFSKLASGYAFLSIGFVLCYGAVLLLLGIYAVFWQQIIKRLPLMTAYANKAVTVVWGIVWGAVIFHEEITLGKALGAVMVIAGVILYVSGDDIEQKRDAARIVENETDVGDLSDKTADTDALSQVRTKKEGSL